MGRASSKDGRTPMKIEDMDISRLMVYVQQVEEEKLRDIEEYRKKKTKTENKSVQQKRWFELATISEIEGECNIIC